MFATSILPIACNCCCTAYEYGMSRWMNLRRGYLLPRRGPTGNVPKQQQYECQNLKLRGRPGRAQKQAPGFCLLDWYTSYTVAYGEAKAINDTDRMIVVWRKVIQQQYLPRCSDTARICLSNHECGGATNPKRIRIHETLKASNRRVLKAVKGISQLPSNIKYCCSNQNRCWFQLKFAKPQKLYGLSRIAQQKPQTKRVSTAVYTYEWIVNRALVSRYRCHKLIPKYEKVKKRFGQYSITVLTGYSF